ncbi:Os07g0589600 [Oryza sativa Japonica Group]|nr:Os07g0589600 [Oryza sativa Japonica Group]|eukprot:NP_001060151.1 Os07g0589600 [Oryza sativa Japonica Group]
MAGAADAAAGGGSVAKDTGDDFEFCVLSSGGLVSAGAGAAAADMCVADEVFSQGKLLPLRLSSAAAGDAAGLGVLPRSESVASTVGFGSRSDSRSASSSGSSSGCVSRSESSKSASSDHSAAHPPPQQQQQPRRSLSSSLFYAHPSPSPQLRTRPPRRSTGSAPPPPPATAWGIFRLGVVGAPDVYPPRSTDSKNAAAAAKVGSSRSARFEPASTAADKKHPVVGLFGDSFGCKCSPDVVEPVTLPAAAKRAKAKNKNKAGDKKAQSVRRSRILDWFEELTITKK